MYSDQVWLDGLYMAQVFRARRAAKNGDERELNDILRQFQMVRAHMYDPALHLYRHAYDASGRAFWADEKGLSRCVWLRAMGWWLAALADAAAVWPASHEGGQWLGACLEEALSGLFPYRDARSGMFLQVVDRACANGNYPETSGSALASYACLRGANTGVLGEGWREEGESVLRAIEREKLRPCAEGFELTGICLVAGLGPESNRRRDGSYAYYLSEPVVANEAKGVAPFLMAYAESASARGAGHGGR